MSDVHRLNVKLTGADNTAFSTDIGDLFGRRKFAHVGNWRYSEPLFPGDKVHGLEIWNRLTERATHGGKYYIFSDEVNLIADSFPEILDFIPENTMLIDLGPGSEEAILAKIGTVLRNTGNRITQYVSVDLVPEILKNAERIFQHSFPQVKFTALQDNIFKPLQLPEQGYRLAVIFGQTLFNIAINPMDGDLAKRKILDLLVALRGHLRPGERIIVPQNCSESPEEIEAAYWEQEEVWLNLFFRVSRDLPIKGDYDPEGFIYEPYWIPSSNILSHTVVPKRIMQFSLGNETLRLRPEDRLYMHNTVIYPVSVFKELTREAKFEVCYCRINDTARMAFYILEPSA
jgi:uncharacterized SAM-dependent methyltransferase